MTGVCRWKCVRGLLTGVCGVCVVRMYMSGKTDEAVMTFSDLVDECSDSTAVRLGDVLGVLVTHHARHAQWKQVGHLSHQPAV